MSELRKELKEVLEQLGKELEEMNGFSRFTLKKFTALYHKIEQHLDKPFDATEQFKTAFLQYLMVRAREYGWDGDYVEVRDFVKSCFESEGCDRPTDDDLEPFDDLITKIQKLNSQFNGHSEMTILKRREPLPGIEQILMDPVDTGPGSGKHRLCPPHEIPDNEFPQGPEKLCGAD